MDPNKANFVEQYLLQRPLPSYRVKWHFAFWFVFLVFHLSYFLPLLAQRSVQPAWLVSYGLYYLRFVPVYYLSAAFFERLKKMYFSLGLLVATAGLMLVVMHLITVALYFSLDQLYGLKNLSESFQTVGSMYLKPIAERSGMDWMIFIYDFQEIQLLFLPLGLKMILYGFAQQLEREKSHRQNLANQLRITRAQTAPHFILNALNAIYAQVLPLSIRAGQHLEAMIGVLHYTLYDTRKEMIDLQTEYDSILHFLALEKERFQGRLSEQTIRNGTIQDSHKVPSLILFTLIENAFKHAVYQANQPVWIRVELTVQRDVLIFSVLNNIPLKAKEDYGHSSGGIGLINIRERLDLIYQGKARVSFNEEGAVFTARLQIPFYPKTKNS